MRSRCWKGRGAELIDDLAQRMEEASQQLRVRAGSAAARPDQRHQGDPLDAVGHAQRHRGHRRRRAVSRAAAITACRSCSCAAGAISAAAISSREPGLAEAGELLSGFLAQYYLGREAPGEILINEQIEDADLLEATLTRAHGTHRCGSAHGVRGVRARWLEMARTNAELGLQDAPRDRGDDGRTAAGGRRRCSSCRAPPARIECFDISHTMGERTVASCVVFGPEGPLKSDYRRFNIEGLAPGDDYGAMRQALSRRYARIKKGEAPMPDLLLIDGGPGQLARGGRRAQGARDRQVSRSSASPRAPIAGRGRSGCSCRAGAADVYCRRIRRPCI